MRDLRWICEEKGCFRMMCPKLGSFDDCFPGAIAMSDVDGVVEIGGRFLFLEWKAQGGSVQTGQRIMFEQLTALSRKITVIVVSGHPRDMIIESVQVFSGGKAQAPEPCNFGGLKSRIAAWGARASLARMRPAKRSAA